MGNEKIYCYTAAYQHRRFDRMGLARETLAPTSALASGLTLVYVEGTRAQHDLSRYSVIPQGSDSLTQRAQLSEYYHPDSSQRPETTTRIKLGEGGRLRSVTLENVTLPWGSPRLSGITHLKIMDPKEQGPSLEELWSILVSSPTLQTLSLCGMSNLQGWYQSTARTQRLISIFQNWRK